MEKVTEVVSDAIENHRLDTLRNIAAKAWPSGKITAFCGKCGKERIYDWDAVVKIMQKGYPRHCGERIQLRNE